MPAEKQNPSTNLPGVFFLSVPESLRGKLGENSGFSINPDIPIPVEIPEDSENLNMEDLSWEMIISGMLRVISSGEETQDRLNYYRNFVLAVKPSILEEFTEAAILKVRNGDFDLSLEIFNALKGLFPVSPSVLLNRALALEEKASMLEQKGGGESEKAFMEAEAAFDEAIALEPPFPEVYFNAGFFYLNRKDFFRAGEYFSLYIGNVELTETENKKINKAKAILKEIETNGLGDENFSEAYKLVLHGKEEAGMNYIREFIERHPTVWNGWFVLGWALRRTGRWKEGAAALNKAVDFGGGNSDTRNELAICLMETGDLKNARRELEYALHDDPENIKIISNLGVLAMKNGNRDEAAAFFRTVLELDPGDKIALRFFGK